MSFTSRSSLPVVFVVFLATSLFAGRTWHVSSSASPEGADGSAGKPYPGISAAAQQAQPGDTVRVGEGVYRERVAPPRGGTEGAPIVYMGVPGERVVVKGSVVWEPQWRMEFDDPQVYSAQPDPALFTDDSQIDGPNPFKVSFNMGEGRTCGQVFIDGERALEQEEIDKVKFFSNAWMYVPEEDRIYVHFRKGESPSNTTVEITVQRRVFAPHKRFLGYITIRNFVFEHCGNQYPGGFYLPGHEAKAQAGMVGTRSGHHWVIENNVIRHAKSLGVDCGQEKAHGVEGELEGVDPRYEYDQDKIGHHRIAGNTFLDNGTDAIMAFGPSDLTIVDNVFLRNNALSHKGPEAAVIKCHCVEKALVEGNLFMYNNAASVYFDNRNNDIRITRNVFAYNRTSAVFVELSRRETVLVDNNIMVDNGMNGVYQHDASKVCTAHNLIANTSGTNHYGSIGDAYFIRNVTDRGSAYTLENSLYNNLLLGNRRDLTFPVPSNRCRDNDADYNVISAAADDRSFSIILTNDYSSFDDMIAEIDRTLGDESPGADAFSVPFKTRATLTHAEWKTYWSRIGAGLSERSLLVPHGDTVKLDTTTFTLTVTIPFEPSSVGARALSELDNDFFGNPIPDDGTAVPGPFQNLKKGRNTFTVWTGEGGAHLPTTKMAGRSTNAPRKPEARGQLVVARPHVHGSSLRIPPGCRRVQLFDLSGRLLGSWSIDPHSLSHVNAMLRRRADGLIIPRLLF